MIIIACLLLQVRLDAFTSVGLIGHETKSLHLADKLTSAFTGLRQPLQNLSSMVETPWKRPARPTHLQQQHKQYVTPLLLILSPLPKMMITLRYPAHFDATKVVLDANANLLLISTFTLFFSLNCLLQAMTNNEN